MKHNKHNLYSASYNTLLYQAVQDGRCVQSHSNQIRQLILTRKMYIFQSRYAIIHHLGRQLLCFLYRQKKITCFLVSCKLFFHLQCVHVPHVGIWERHGRRKDSVLHFMEQFVHVHVDSCVQYLSDDEEQRKMIQDYTTQHFLRSTQFCFSSCTDIWTHYHYNH